MKLFPELMISIIEEVTTPDSPLAYTYPDSTRGTLLNLALVSHTVSSLTMPFIYARIPINSQNQLHMLHRTLCSKSAVRHHVTSFAILKPSGSEQDYELTQVFIQQLCDLLDVMSPCLQRLLVDLPSMTGNINEELIKGPLRYAFMRLPHLVEFVSIRQAVFIQYYDGYHSVLRNWRSLRRLALWQLVINRELGSVLSELPHLQHFVMVQGWHDLAEIIRRSSSLRIIAFIDPPKWQLNDLLPIMKERNDIRFDLHLPGHLLQHPDAATQSWFRFEVERGTLWGGGGPTWEKRLNYVPWEEALRAAQERPTMGWAPMPFSPDYIPLTHKSY